MKSEAGRRASLVTKQSGAKICGLGEHLLGEFFRHLLGELVGLGVHVYWFCPVGRVWNTSSIGRWVAEF